MNPYIYPGIGSLQVRLQVEAKEKDKPKERIVVTFEDVLTASLHIFNGFHGHEYSQEEVKSKTRKRTAVEVRQCSMFVIKHFTPKATLKAISLFMGGRDHSTVIHGLRTWQNLMDTDKRYRELTEQVIDIAKLIPSSKALTDK